MNLNKNAMYTIFLFLAFSVFLGPIFYMVTFFMPNILNSYWSWNITNLMAATVTTIAFICLFVVTLITFRYIDKLTKPIILFVSIAVSGFFCIYIGVAWLYEIYVIIVILNGAWLGFVAPTIIKMTRMYFGPQIKSTTVIYIPLIVTLVWTLLSMILFLLLGVGYWRVIYIGAGVFNLVAAGVIIFVKMP